MHDLSFLPRQAGWCTEAGDGAGGWALDTAPVAAALRQAPPQSSNAPVLLHGDYWPGNWLWQNGRLAAIIDWEDAALGDPLRDLAQSRLELAWIHDAAAAAAFTRAYLARRPLDTSALPYWDLCAALRLARLVGDDLAGWAASSRHTAVTIYRRGASAPPMLRLQRRRWQEYGRNLSLLPAHCAAPPGHTTARCPSACAPAS